MRNYYIDVGGKKKGPYTLNQLRAMWTQGTISARDLYCEEGGDKWRKLEMMQSILESGVTKPKNAANETKLGQWCLIQFKKLSRLLKP